MEVLPFTSCSRLIKDSHWDRFCSNSLGFSANNLVLRSCSYYYHVPNPESSSSPIPTCPDALPNLSSDLLQVRSQPGRPVLKCQTNLVPAAVRETPRIESLLGHLNAKRHFHCTVSNLWLGTLKRNPTILTRWIVCLAPNRSNLAKIFSKFNNFSKTNSKSIILKNYCTWHAIVPLTSMRSHCRLKLLTNIFLD